MNRYFLISLSIYLLPFTAHAQCTMPNGPDAAMGVIIFNKAHKVMQYCNGDNWIGLWGSGGGNSLPSCADDEIVQWQNSKWECSDGSALFEFIESDPKVGATTSNKWCRGSGSQIVCDQDAPSSDLTCASGVSLAGACWYLGMSGESCTTVCAPFGGYHDATNTYAGYGGNLNYCINVARAMGLLFVQAYNNANHHSANQGCTAQWSDPTIIARLVGSATTAAAAMEGLARFCAYNN